MRPPMIEMLGVLTLTLWLAPALQATSPGGKELTLVSEGRPTCVIVAQPDRPGARDPRQAGIRPLSENLLDFQRILEKMSGAKIPIVGPDQVPGDGVKIYIGVVPLPAAITFEEAELDPRGYWIIAAENALVLRGKTYGGTINALYGFLQDKLGVRWFFPSELFEVAPRQATITIPYCREMHNPSFKGGMFITSTGLNQDGEVWCERMRRDEGAWRYQGPMVHYLGYILDSAKYGKEHPEFYPLINGERRVPPPGRADSEPQPCLSNPALVEEVIAFCRKALDENPQALMVAIGENDSTDWCTCDACQALDVLPLEKVNGMEQHSDRYFTFANQVARGVAKTHPGKMVGCLAYNGTVSVPRKIDKLEPNVAIGMCIDNSQYYDPAYRARDYAMLAAWQQKCQMVCTYDYLSLGWTAPRYYPRLYAAHLKEMPKYGVVGLYSEIHPYWAAFGPMIYLTAQLMWDIEQNPDALLDDLFLQLFGKEAGIEMKAYYDVFETAWTRLRAGRNGKYFEGWSSMQEQMAVYTLADLDQALLHLERTKALAKDSVARRRVDYVADSFAYSANLMRGWLTSDAIDAAVNAGEPRSPEQAKTLHENLRVVAEMLKNEEPVYQATLLVDPLSAKAYYKSDRDDHFGIIRGAWAPRCNYSLSSGAAALVKYCNDQGMAAELTVLENVLPKETMQAAKAAAVETLGPEGLAKGDMEGANLSDKWEAGGAGLSADADAHGGQQSLKIAASIDFGRAVQTFPVKPGTKYKYDFWYKCSRPGALYMYVNIKGETSCIVGESLYYSEWTRATGSFATPAGCDTAYVGFCGWPDKPTLVDDVSIREVLRSDLISCKKVDVSFPDWNQPTFMLNTADTLGTGTTPEKWRGAEQFSVATCLGWQEDGLRLVVKVRDVEHFQRYSGGDMWNGDSIQFGLDMAGDSARRGFGSGYDKENDFLYGLSQLDAAGSQPELYCWNAPGGQPAKSMANDGSVHRYSISAGKNEVLYDVLVAWKQLGVVPQEGHVFGFNLVVFDRYPKAGGGSELVWLQLTPGIAGSEGQSPALWREFVLTGN